MMRLSLRLLGHPPVWISAQSGFPLCHLGSLHWETDCLVAPVSVVGRVRNPSVGDSNHLVGHR